MWATRVGNWDIHPRMKKTHFNSIVKDFTSKSSKKLWKNEFANTQSKTEYPILASLLEEAHTDGVFEEDFSPEMVSGDSSIGRKNIEIQWHQASVEEHTDDVCMAFFKMVVLGLKRAADTQFDIRPVFNYYDYHGKNRSMRLQAGDVVIFNPRKNHSMIYYGAEYMVAMVDVYIKGE